MGASVTTDVESVPADEVELDVLLLHDVIITIATTAIIIELIAFFILSVIKVIFRNLCEYYKFYTKITRYRRQS